MIGMRKEESRANGEASSRGGSGLLQQSSFLLTHARFEEGLFQPPGMMGADAAIASLRTLYTSAISSGVPSTRFDVTTSACTRRLSCVLQSMADESGGASRDLRRSSKG